MTKEQANLLAIGELLIWAALFYSFPALLPHWEEKMQWSRDMLSLAFTGAILISALLAPIAGHCIDKGHGRIIMRNGAMIAALCLVGLAFATTITQFIVLWVIIGACMAFCLYEPCMAYCVLVCGQSARKIVTHITLVAGFAGTLSFPFAHIIQSRFDIQAVLFGYALMALLAAFCFHLAMLPNQTADLPLPKDSTSPAKINRKIFILLAAAFSLIMLAHGMIIAHILPLLHSRNISIEIAVLAAAMIGPMQVVGRMALKAIENRLSIYASAIAMYGIMGLGMILLYFASNNAALIFIFVACHGAGYGANAILRPIITANLLGRRVFGTISGAIALPMMIALALASSIAAAIWSLWNYGPVILLGASCVLASIILIILARTINKPEF